MQATPESEHIERDGLPPTLIYDQQPLLPTRLLESVLEDGGMTAQEWCLELNRRTTSLSARPHSSGCYTRTPMPSTTSWSSTRGRSWTATSIRSPCLVQNWRGPSPLTPNTAPPNLPAP